MSQLGMTKTTALDMDAAEGAIRESLANEGFGVLTEIDVAATFKEKLDIDRSPYKILGACKPALANAALTHDEQIGLLLPCNVTLSQTDDGTIISIVDPFVMLSPVEESAEMNELATSAKASLVAALDAVPETA
ncbi:MAG: DUF302 domain-containing protein [Acidimicrobiia bacterium]